MRDLNAVSRQSRALTALAATMLIGFAAALVGMAVDPRVIGGVSAWLKPAKFAISTAIFSVSIAWVFSYLKPTVTLKRLGRTLAASLLLEVAVIFAQAFRGTTSQFNRTSPLNTVLFTVMGIGIAVIWVATVGVFLAAMRQRFEDAAWGWALRLGLMMTVIGSAAGSLMLRPRPEQARQMELHRHLTTLGGHTVGAADGEPGLPGLGWSTDHGDLRIPHFLGLHGLQIIPLFAWLVRRRRRAAALVWIAAASYLTLFLILTAQALRGESVTRPGTVTVAALALWILASAGAAGWALLPCPAPGLRPTESRS